VIGAGRLQRLALALLARRRLAIVIAAMPTDELPPRISSDSRRCSSSVSSDPQAVPKLSGIAPSRAQSSVVWTGITDLAGSRAYCA